MTVTLPAEWAPQSAIQLTWPRPDGDFADRFEAVERNFIILAATISRFQDVIIGYGFDAAELQYRLVEAGAVAERLKIFAVEADDVWARDHGPITVFRDGRPAHLDFVFNGWGNKFDATLDNQVTLQLKEAGAWSAPVESLDFVLEG
ncbi:UNVERIFIED_CONTAM: agmatine deiminase family protein, partial [Salmonella enterica subsp. enterica serovar Weltevreden]